MVSPWQHRREPVPGEQLIRGEAESDGCGQVEALSEDARTTWFTYVKLMRFPLMKAIKLISLFPPEH